MINNLVTRIVSCSYRDSKKREAVKQVKNFTGASMLAVTAIPRNVRRILALLSDLIFRLAVTAIPRNVRRNIALSSLGNEGNLQLPRFQET